MKTYRDKLQEFELRYILRMAMIVGPHQQKIAAQMGVHRNTVSRILKESGWKHSNLRMWCDGKANGSLSQDSPEISRLTEERDRYKMAFEKARDAALADGPMIARAILDSGLREENERLKASLADAAIVHTNILRGTVALTKAQAIHIAGLPADVEQLLAGKAAVNQV